MRTAASLAAALLLTACGAGELRRPAPPPAPAAAEEAPAAARAIDHRGAGPLLSGVQAGGDIAVHVHHHHHHHASRPGATAAGGAPQAARPAPAGTPPLHARRPEKRQSHARPSAATLGIPAASAPGGARHFDAERAALAGALREREGLRLEPYVLGGLVHECYGALGSDGRRKTVAECEARLAADMATALADARDFAGAAVGELAYMVGAPRLAKFKDLRAALRALDYRRAAAALLDSPPLIEDVGLPRVAAMAERLRDGS